jgi:hypothetical protein
MIIVMKSKTKKIHVCLVTCQEKNFHCKITKQIPATSSPKDFLELIEHLI